MVDSSIIDLFFLYSIIFGVLMIELFVIFSLFVQNVNKKYLTSSGVLAGCDEFVESSSDKQSVNIMLYLLVQ